MQAETRINTECLLRVSGGVSQHESEDIVVIYRQLLGY